MAEPRSASALTLTASGVHVSLAPFSVAALRHASPDGPMAAAIGRSGLGALPRPLEARVTAAEAIMAWRSPTETLLLSEQPDALTELAARLPPAADGYLVELTPGIRVLRVTGEAVTAVLCRLGGSTGVPRPGEAQRSRMADVPVLTLAVRPGEVLLLVDRALLTHLHAWLAVTLADLAS